MYSCYTPARLDPTTQASVSELQGCDPASLQTPKYSKQKHPKCMREIGFLFRGLLEQVRVSGAVRILLHVTAVAGIPHVLHVFGIC